jgi:hypothetical protein
MASYPARRDGQPSDQDDHQQSYTDSLYQPAGDHPGLHHRDHTPAWPSSRRTDSIPSFTLCPVQGSVGPDDQRFGGLIRFAGRFGYTEAAFHTNGDVLPLHWRRTERPAHPSRNPHGML